MTRYRVSMDIGGTFTDVVAYDEETGRFTAGKASTTPDDLTRGVLTGLDRVVESGSDIDFMVHGTTQGINAFLERRGVPVLLLATEGFGDIYHIARGNRARLYDVQYRKPEPLVPRANIVEIPSRLDPTGAERHASRRGGGPPSRREVQAGRVRRHRGGLPLQLRKPGAGTARGSRSARGARRRCYVRSPHGIARNGVSTSARRRPSSTHTRGRSCGATGAVRVGASQPRPDGHAARDAVVRRHRDGGVGARAHAPHAALRPRRRRHGRRRPFAPARPPEPHLRGHGRYVFRHQPRPRGPRPTSATRPERCRASRS